MSLTEEIYQELIEGLEKGLDWHEVLDKHSASKGPLYNALGRVFTEIPAKLAVLNEKRKQVQAKLDEAGLRLDQLNQKINEADKALGARNHNVKALEEKESALKKQIEVLESDVREKGKLSERLQELEKLGLDEKRLRALRTALVETGTKRGLKPNEAINKFFAELKDYDAVQGFGQELQRLESVIKTKTLEAERWQAETDSLSRRHKDLSKAIAAVQSLAEKGVKVDQIVSWDALVSKLGGPEGLEDKLGQYKSVSELVAAKKTEMEDCDKKVRQLSGQIKVLNEQKVEIEGAIKSLSGSGVNEIAGISDKASTELKSLSSSGVKKITEVGEKAVTELQSLSASGVKEITKVSGTAMAELKSFLAEIRVETKKLADLKAEAGKLEKELMYARYLTTTDQAVLKAFPREVVFAFLDRAASYCKLNDLNPKVRMPDHIYDKYYDRHGVIVWAHPEVSILDLVSWLQGGFAGASQ